MRVAVIGAGTIIFNDEGVGVYAQKYLENNYEFSSDITFVDGGVLGFKLMVYYQEFDKVIILDTITMKDEKAGTIYNMPASELMGLGSYKQTAHEVEIVEMLEICSLGENMAEINIIGIVPQDILEVRTNLTEEIKSNFDNFINTSLKQIESYDIRYKKKETIVTLETIIYAYDNPLAQRDLQGLR